MGPKASDRYHSPLSETVIKSILRVFKHKYIFKLVVCSGTKAYIFIISGHPTIRFSSNFLDSKIALGRIICANLNEFLSAKFEISLQTQENSAVGQESLFQINFINNKTLLISLILVLR